MPVRALLSTDRPAELLLGGLVDYAGLFPPAALAMDQAVRQYAHQRAGGTGWILGRFICPAAALGQLSTHGEPFFPRDAGAIPWRIAVTATDDVSADLQAIERFNARHRTCFEECGAVVDVLEARAADGAVLDTLLATVPAALTLYVELPVVADPAPLMARIAAAGRRAKMRTGGVTPEAFPSTSQVARFLAAGVRFGVPCKATAGLHHALAGDYPLSDDPSAPAARQFGYLNMILAAAVLAAGGSTTDAAAALEESDPGTITLDDAALRWRHAGMEHAFDRTALQRLRESGFVSFGSCSFTEPVGEARALGLLG